MNKFVIGTFYTKNTPYQDIFNKFFLESVMQYSDKLEWKVSVVENQGSWIKNVAQKPKVILDMLDSMHEMGDDRALVFLDSDATIEKFPNIFNKIPEEIDMAFHRLDWSSWYRNGTNRKELLTGTMFLRNNEKVRLVVKEWYEKAIKTDIWEQQVLEQILPGNLNIQELPLCYCYIKTMPNGSVPNVVCTEPVIVHHQVSRKLKKEINK